MMILLPIGDAVIEMVELLIAITMLRIHKKHGVVGLHRATTECPDVAFILLDDHGCIYFQNPNIPAITVEAQPIPQYECRLCGQLCTSPYFRCGAWDCSAVKARRRVH
jgi:hypothetical protein